MRISDWSSDVCSSDLEAVPLRLPIGRHTKCVTPVLQRVIPALALSKWNPDPPMAQFCRQRVKGPKIKDIEGRERPPDQQASAALRSEEHTSELQSLMRISYAVFCLKKKTTKKHKQN